MGYYGLVMMCFFERAKPPERECCFMKRIDSFTVKVVGNDFVAVATGDFSKKFGGAVKLNESGMLLWKMLINDVTVDELTEALTAEYDVDEETARNDVQGFLQNLCDAGLLCND